MTLIVTPWDGQPIDKPGVYSGVPMSEYHGPNLCVGPSISSSGLRKIFTESPMNYWIKSPYNPRALPQDDSRAFTVGRAAHHLCLGEADFKKHFIVRPEEYTDPKTGELKKWTMAAGACKTWVAQAKLDGLDVLTPSELETTKGLAGIQPWQDGLEDSGLLNNALVRGGALHGLIEHTIIGYDEGAKVWLKARPDVIPVDSTEASDFKTTTSVDSLKLMFTLDDYRYDMQAELIARCLRQVPGGFELTNFALIFAVKEEPHEIAVRELKQYDIEQSRLDNDVAIRTFGLCMETGRWPGCGGGEEDARYLERSDRNRTRAENRRAQLHRFVFGS